MKPRLLLLVAAPLLFCLGCGWLLATQSGLQALASFAGSLTGAQFEQVEGRLYDHVRIGRLQWQNAATHIDVERAELQWTPQALLHGQLRIATLHVGTLAIAHQGNDDAPPALPDSLKPPFDYDIASLTLDRVTFNGAHLLEHVQATLSGRDGEHRIEALSMQREALRLSASGTLAMRKPYALSLAGGLSGAALDKPFALDWRIGGTLERNAVSAQRSAGPFALDAEATLRPFAASLSGKIESLKMQAQGLDLAGFDPRAPRTRIEGDIAANLLPDDRLHLSFSLRDAVSTARAKGAATLSASDARDVDVRLDLGDNRAMLQGAFGRPDDTLGVNVDAPRLAAFGISGDLRARLQLGGTLGSPKLNGTVSSATLRAAGIGRMQGLALNARMGASLDAPLELRLRLARLDLAAHPDALGGADLNLSGTRRRHALTFAARIDDAFPFRLAAQGGLDAASNWQGVLTQLSLDNLPAPWHSLALNGQAPLAAGATHWSLGPLDLRAHHASAHLAAAGRAGKSTLALVIDQADIGHAQLDLSMKTPEAWAFSAQAPWQGKLQLDMADLAWLDPMLGPAWHVGGKVVARIGIGGTPQRPRLDGQVSADALSLRQLDNNLDLRNGSLRASLHDSILVLDAFDAQSMLTAPPDALRKLMPDRGAALIATPGRISAEGRMNLSDPGNDDQLHLRLNLDRLGLWQTPKQWLLLSGQGQLGWKQGRLDLDAKLGVDAAHWQLADLSRPQLSNDVIVHRVAEGEKPRKQTSWNGSIDVDLGRWFSFVGAGVSGQLAGQVRIVAGNQDLPRASGTVNLVNGHYDAYGQSLDIERGILNFQGLLENPALNIRAMRRNLQVEAGVEITGTAQAPRVRLVSDPDVPDTEKLSWLVLGRPPEQEGGDAGLLFAAAGAIFGGSNGGVTDGLKRTFGIDELNVRSGALGQQQAMSSRIVSLQDGDAGSTGQVLSVGKQLSDRLRLSWEQAIGGVGNLVKLTLKLGRRVSLVGTSGDDAALDVIYSFSFGGGDRREGR